MVFNQIITLLFIALTLASVEHSSCQVLKGTVRCLDCNKDYDFSGIKVAVECNQVKKLVETTTSKDGTFKTELPADTRASTHRGPVNCLAKVLGGPNQLYASKKDMVSNVVMDHGSGDSSSSYTISKPLSFITHKTYANIVSSKTIDFPLPKEWGLAPSSYYMYPYIPIIGIP